MINNTTVFGYSVPYVIEQTSKGERTYDIYSRLLQDRIVFISGEVQDEMANAICAQLLFLQAVDPEKEISVYINSPGGVVTAGLAIYDTMKLVSCPIATYCMGQAASMGAFLLSAGDKGKRSALPHARIMIHQPSGSTGPSSKISDMEISVNESKRLKRILTEILAENCNQTYKNMEKACDRDYFMSATDAVKFGLIDKVL